MIIVTGAIHATEDSFGKLLAASIEHCERSRGEPGCIAHNVHVDCENKLRLVFLEFWRDEAAFKAHFELAASKDFGAFVHANAAEPPDIQVHQATRLSF